MSGIEPLREQLERLDREILERVRRRQDLALAIGERKVAAGRPTRDFAREREVFDRTSAWAEELGLSTDLAASLTRLLIESSLTVQEQDRVSRLGAGEGRRALVIGGSGRMGRWMVRFLGSQGFAVEVADPVAPDPGLPHHPDWSTVPLDHDVVVLASPLRTTREILETMVQNPPPGLVFDIGSLKSPLREPLLALAAAGARVTSIHPMFGPDTELLSGRHVVFVDVGVPEATGEARRLFASTMALQVDMDLEAHDRLVATILGLSHAVNIAFFTAMAASGEPASRLAQLSSTTFGAQLALARGVAHENPHLYFEIQSLNTYGGEALNALAAATATIRDVVRAGDEDAFTRLMETGRAYLSGMSGDRPSA